MADFEPGGVLGAGNASGNANVPQSVLSFSDESLSSGDDLDFGSASSMSGSGASQVQANATAGAMHMGLRINDYNRLVGADGGYMLDGLDVGFGI